MDDDDDDDDDEDEDDEDDEDGVGQHPANQLIKMYHYLQCFVTI